MYPQPTRSVLLLQPKRVSSCLLAAARPSLLFPFLVRLALLGSYRNPGLAALSLAALWFLPPFPRWVGFVGRL
jgi:hypothetical protein